MASQSGEHDELWFTGESAEEAQDFVQAVHRRAFAAGRQRDNAWIADFACPCFSRKALLWYETLDEETQTDWKLLKRAILAEFSTRQPDPATVPSAAPALVTSLSSLTPVNPPPSPVTVQIGRIRIDLEDHTTHGYLWMSRWMYAAVTTNRREANLFEVDTSDRTLRFQEDKENLVIRADKPFINKPLIPSESMFGCMRRSSVGTLPLWNHTWSIAEDGTLTATLLGSDGDQCDAIFMVHRSDLGQRINVSTEKERSMKSWAWNHRPATLHLEPLS